MMASINRQTRHLKHRRAVLSALLASTLSPLVAAGEEDRVRSVGYLSNGSGPEVIAKRLAERGWVEGKNLRFEVRKLDGWDARNPHKYDAAAAELVRARVDVLLAFGSGQVKVLMAATKTIPIVCGGTPDPVGSGLTHSIRRSGTNVTGISYGIPEQAAIQVDLLRAVRPGLKRIVMIMHEDSHEGFVVPLNALTDSAKAAGVSWDWAPASTFADADAAFAKIRDPVHEVAWVMANKADDEFPLAGLAQIALRRRIATMCEDDMVRAGGLMAYSIDHADQMGRIAAIMDKLLRGANAADTPFELPDRTTFLLNRATANAIGVKLAPDLLLRATEVIG